MTRRSALHVLMLVSVLAVSFAVAEHVLRQPTPCDKCGASMRPFMEGDPLREDSDILECPKCGYLVNTRHTRR